MGNQLEDEREINNGFLRRAHARRSPRLPNKKSLSMSAKTRQARSPTRAKYHHLSRLNMLITILPSQPLLTSAMMPPISWMMPVKISSSQTTSIVPSHSPSGAIRSGYLASSLATFYPLEKLSRFFFFRLMAGFLGFSFVGCKVYRAAPASSSF